MTASGISAAVPEPLGSLAVPAADTVEAQEAAPAGSPLRLEPLSPFVPWSAQERGPIPAGLGAEPEGSLLFDLLRSPDAMVERLLEREPALGAVLASLALIAGCSAVASFLIISAWAGFAAALRGTLLVPAATLLTVAAALGPIYAVGVLYSVRLPLARLVGALLASVASGCLLLAALAPVPYILWRLDDHWGGPLAVVAVFLAAGAASGARLRQLLRGLALCITRRALADPEASLTKKQTLRVDLLARDALVLVSLLFALAGWAWLQNV